MTIDSLSPKQASEIEQQVSRLLNTLRKAKLFDEPVYTSLQELEQQLGEIRRRRFDEDNTEYSGY